MNAIVFCINTLRMPKTDDEGRRTLYRLTQSRLSKTAVVCKGRDLERV